LFVVLLTAFSRHQEDRAESLLETIPEFFYPKPRLFLFPGQPPDELESAEKLISVATINSLYCCLERHLIAILNRPV
jgi:hypothetical protein